MNKTDAYLPQSKNWFEENVAYEGEARVDFEDPKGWIEGTAKVEFNIRGEANVEMSISDFHNPNITNGHLALQKLFTKHKEDEQFRIIYPIENKNKCISFKIETSEFSFIAKGEIFYNFNFFSNKDKKLTLRFFKSEFNVKTSEHPKYWIFPLLNFISTVEKYHNHLYEHPLRLYTFPEIPKNGFSDVEIFVMQNKQFIKNALITFAYEDTTGFIELVPDYNDRKDSLENGETPYAITAIMNGEISNPLNENSDFNSQLPIQYLDLLSIATGTRVGLPWIEIRSATGKLITRIHAPKITRKYTKGHLAIDDNIHRGISTLLTESPKSKYFGKSYIIDTIELLILSSENRSYSIIDRFAYICRAIDTLCEQLGFREDFRLKNYISENDYNTVKKILSDARIAIEDFKTQSSINQTGKDILTRIESNISQTSFEEGFGKYLTRMLDNLELHDIAIMDRFFSLSPITYRRKNKSQKAKSWGDVLTFYRGIAIHNVSYFHSDSKHSNMLYVLTKHLHDITLRIIFKLLDYNGYYQPIVKDLLTNNCSVDWVSEETSWADLGYETKD